MIRRAPLGLLLLCACSSSWRNTPPKSATKLELARPSIASRELANGLRFAVAEAGSQLADVEIAWRISRVDAPSGLGAATWLAPQVLADDDRWLAVIHQLGAQQHWDQDRDGAVLGATALATDVDPVLNAMGRIVREPRCDDADLAARKRAFVSERSVARASEQARATLRRSIFGPGHPYRPIEAHDVEALTCADVLEVMKWGLTPDRLALTVSGGVTVARVERLVAGYFGSLTGTGVRGTPSVAVPPRRVVTLDQGGSPQVVIAMGRFIARYNGDTQFNLNALRETASFASSALRHWNDIAYGVYVSVDELAYGYELSITTTVPAERAAEALPAMLAPLSDPSRIQRANVLTTFSRRMTMLQHHMLRYQTVEGINDEIAFALLKGQSANRTIQDLYSVRDGDWGESILWASSRIDPAAMSIVLVGDRAFTGPALKAAGLAPTP